MKIIIVTALLMAIVTPAYGAQISPLSNDRLLFMCAVETIECPAPVPKEVPLEVTLASDEVSTSSLMEHRHIEQLKAIIVQLQELIIKLKANQ